MNKHPLIAESSALAITDDVEVRPCVWTSASECLLSGCYGLRVRKSLPPAMLLILLSL